MLPITFRVIAFIKKREPTYRAALTDSSVDTGGAP